MSRTRRVPTVEELRSLHIQREAARIAGVMEVPAVFEMSVRIRELESELQGYRSAPNKLTVADMRQGLDAILKRHGVEPADEAIKILLDPESRLSPKERAHMWLELMQYRMPKLKAIDHTGRVDGNLTLVVMKFGTNEVMSERPLQIDKTSGDVIEVEVTRS